MKTNNNNFEMTNVFGNNFIEAKNLFIHAFNKIPSFCFVTNINGKKAYEYFLKNFESFIQNKYEYRYYEKFTKESAFPRTIIVLYNGCVLDFYTWGCQMFYMQEAEAFVLNIKNAMRKFKERTKREPNEMNILVKNGNYLEFKEMPIKKTKLDLSLFYNDDFIETDSLITKRLNTKDDKGIVLLHGLPGAGKTSYLRYLIGKLKKKVIFLSPNMATELVNPEFMEMLIENPDSIVIIEDAENIITDRKFNSSSSVSNLLNISDGLLSDFLNVQLVCTFNNSLTMVDSALMRKGRLIAKYEFGKLTVKKAQKLSAHFGHTTTITTPMTIAEIANPNEANTVFETTKVIGFSRRNQVELN
jgi:hypothetical protein